jgi:hypothetical protein
MISKLEQAIVSNVLPEFIEFSLDTFYLSIDISNKKYWVGYTTNHECMGDKRIPEKRQQDHCFETLDEAVDVLVPILWSVLREATSQDGRMGYEEYCLDLVYAPVFSSIGGDLYFEELDFLRVEVNFDREELAFEEATTKLIENLHLYIKAAIKNGDRIPLPRPFNMVEY